MLETIHLSHLPPTLPLYIALYKSVQNAPFLRQQLLAGNADYEYAFVDASMILSRTHILAACFRAVNDYLNGRLKSRNVHSEIVFALGPSNNILEAFRKFGVQESTTDLLVIKVPVPAPVHSSSTGSTTTAPTTSKESIEYHLRSAVQGTPSSFDNETLAGIYDVAKVRKAYKIGAAPPTPKKDRIVPDQAEVGTDRTNVVDVDERTRLERAVLGAIALRGAT